MCGDLGEDDRGEGDLHRSFLVHARALASRARARPGDDLNGYLDQLFGELLERCLNDTDLSSAPQAYERMAMQSLVLGRLAGFLAGHVALDEDPLRKLLEAVMLGYGEAEATARGEDHHHGDGHHHDHDHPHADEREMEDPLVS